MILRFETFEFDTEQRELRREGVGLTLQPKVYVVLEYLLNHHDRAVSKAELLDACWPNEFVTESAMTRCIRLIRQVVGDDGNRQQVIKTVRGYGYRFAAEVTERSAVPNATDAEIDPPLPAENNLPDTPFLPAPERRQLTVLSCGLVEAGALLTRLEPDDLHLLMRAMHTTCAAISERYDGFIAHHSEQGTVVYFGYPQAHEDDARRVVLTGLALVAGLPPSFCKAVSLPMAQLAVRVGIHTGLVVTAPEIGTMQSKALATGRAPTLAAGLRDTAPPHMVVLSEATLALVRGYVDVKALTPYKPPDGGLPMSIYQVLGESGARTRLEAASRHGLTPLVGREAEQALLHERWRQVQEGMGQVVVLSGEAGIGKSRLAQVFTEWVADDPHTLLECRSSPYFQNTALYPIVELLQRRLDFNLDDPPERKVDKLEQGLRPYKVVMEEAVPLLAPLLSVPLPEDRYPPLSLSPQQQRQKTLAMIVAMLLRQAEQHPVLFILEDLHWMDPSTMELLELLLEQVPTTALYVLLTCRPDFELPWRHRSYLTQMTLNRLSRDQIAQMVAGVAGKTRLPAEVLQQIVDKTDGVPLFVEEMTKAVIESEASKGETCPPDAAVSLSAMTIPATLQDFLMARLDRLGTAKSIAQYGAVIGRQFSYELLHGVSQVKNATLQHELERLVETELLYQRGVPPKVTYTFKHALIQDTAYQSLLKSTRKQYHRQIARVLEEQLPETAESQPELLAYHCTEGGLIDQAIGHWHQAGELAIARSANQEAIHHFTHGLELLTTLPDSSTRSQQELALLTKLGPALMATKGYADAEVEETYARARELCQQVEQTPQLFPVLWGLWMFSTARARHQTALELGEQLLALAQHTQDTALLLEAHHALWTTAIHLGEVVTAHTHTKQGITLYSPTHHHAHTFLYGGHDPGVCGYNFASRALWLLGYPEQALQQSHAALSLAQQLSHPFSLALAQYVSAMLYQCRWEAQAVQEQAEAALALARAHGFPYIVALSTLLCGWALAEQSNSDRGLSLMQQGFATLRETGNETFLPWCLASLAEVYGKACHIEEGLTALDEALRWVEKNEERGIEAELYRLKGTLQLQQSADNTTETESYFHKALDIARQQQAKSWELRAATSLARLWQSQGKRQEAYDLLQPVYAWFTEGFDTADLKDAKLLLDELS